MSSESTPGKGVAEQGPLLSTGITASSSASEVIDFLRTSFRQMDFSLGQKILTDRENALKAEIESLKRANESAHRVRESENCKMGAELQRVKNENIDLAENNARLKREIEELKAEKKEVEERLEASEERYVWLDKRVSRMEENLAYVATRVPNVSNIADKLDDDELAAENDGLSFGTENHLGPSATKVGGTSSSPKKEVSYVVLSDDEDEMPVDNDEVLGKSEMILGPQMNEVKGESLRRKRIIGNDDDDGDSSSFCSQKRKLVHETEVTPVFDSPKNHGDAGMSTYEPIARVKCEPIVSPMAGKSTASHLNLEPQKVGSGPWLDQSEMLLAFANDRELCMSAVCALYRKLISAPLSLKPMDRGFDSNDQLGVELAKYLIDGHPENKLNRAMSDISKVAAEQSIRLALKYSGQLFRIYSSGEDPLFCHNSTSSRR